MKKQIAILLTVCLLVCSGTAFAAPSWEPLPTQTATSADTQTSYSAHAQGSIGGWTEDGIDIDGDGKIDVVVPIEDMIQASVPLLTFAQAEMYADEKRFSSPEYEVVNTGKCSLSVTISSFTPRQGNPLSLVGWNSATGQDDIAIKLMAPRQMQDVWEQDVTTMPEGGYTLVGSLAPGQSTRFRLDGNYTKDMLQKHAETTTEFSCVYKIGKVRG